MLGVELTYSLSLDISSFSNIDLHRRGYYRLHFNLKPSTPQGSVTLQCCTKRNRAAGKDEWCRIINDGCTAMSAPVLVQYTKQDCSVDSHFIGTVTQVVPAKLACASKCQWPQIEASMDLYFAPLRKEVNTYSTPPIASFEKVDTRPFVLTLCSSTHQLHSARYILFHCKKHCGAKFQLHMALTGTKPVQVEKTKDKGPLLAWLPSMTTDELPTSASIRPVPTVSSVLLRQLCTLLLESQGGLADKCQDIVSTSALPTDRQNITLRVDDLLRGCDKEVPFAQAVDYLNTASAVALSMWDVFRLVLAQERSAEERLLCEFHQQQVNRFRHLHFLVKLPMAELLSSSSSDSKLTFTSACDVMSALTKTGYTSAMFSQSPAVLCPETDGTGTNAPAIMEQRFIRQAPNNSLGHFSVPVHAPQPPNLTRQSTAVATPVLATDGVFPRGGGAAAASGAHNERSMSIDCVTIPAYSGTPPTRARPPLERRVTYSGVIMSPPACTLLSTDSNQVDGLFHRRNNPRASRGTVQSARQSVGSAQERLRPHLPRKWTFLSEVNRLTVLPAYFTRRTKPLPTEVHLVVCVHGLEGRSEDLVALKNFIEVALPDQPLLFLMAHCLEDNTLVSFDQMGQWLALEIVDFIQDKGVVCTHMSFVGHSLGNIAIRSAIAHPYLQDYYNVFHTYLSLAGPHLGTVYSSSLVGAGMWLLQKYTKSSSLLELTMRDDADPRKTLLYRLSQKPGLALFRSVLLVSSHQDQYVPFHSARIEVSPLAGNDEMASAQQEMVHNILFPLLAPTCNTELRIYNLVHQFPNTDVDVLVGRAGHVAILDSELCMEMLVQTCLNRFFQTA